MNRSYDFLKMKGEAVAKIEAFFLVSAQTSVSISNSDLAFKIRAGVIFEVIASVSSPNTSCCKEK